MRLDPPVTSPSGQPWFVRSPYYGVVFEDQPDLHPEARRINCGKAGSLAIETGRAKQFSGGSDSNGGAEFASRFPPVHPVTGCELDTALPRRRAPSLCLNLTGNRWFESISPQRRVRCEPHFFFWSEAATSDPAAAIP